MKWCLFIILTVTISNCDPTQQKKPPKAINGILDLRSVTVLKQNPQVTTEQPVSLDTAKEHVVSKVEPWNFEKDGVVKLDGEWEFYWKELLAHEDFQKGLSNSLISKSGNINVPGSWRGYEIKGSGSKKSEIATGDGYATFRLKVLLPQTNDLSLKLKFFGTAYELFIDGKSVAKNGIVGKTRANSVPDNRPFVIPIKNSQNEIELILQCSNFHGPEAGFWYSIILGETDQVQLLRLKSMALDLFLCGSLLIMGMYHLGLFYFRRKDISTFYFGLFCLLISLRSAITGEAYFLLAFPDFSYQWRATLEFLTIYLGSPLMVMFLRSIFPKDFHRIPYFFIITFSFLLSAVVLLTPSGIFTYTLKTMQYLVLITCVYIIFSIGRAIYHKTDGASSFSIGLLILIGTVINDILFQRKLINTGYYLPFGLFLFIFSQAYILSTRFSKAFMKVEELSATLEQSVSKRTGQLTSALTRITDDVRMAKKIQENMLPRKLDKWQNLEIFAQYFPMTEIGGDYYDITLLENGTIRVFIADATGHGIQAALMTMTIHAEYLNIRDYSLSPGQVLTILNNQYCERYHRLNTFFTCFLADIELSNNRVVFSSAGHPEQLIIHSGNVKVLHIQNRLMGLLQGYEYKDNSHPFFSGDRLLIFTDGIFEEFNSEKEEFGEQRLLELVDSVKNLPVEEFSGAIISTVLEFLSDIDKSDDITLLTVERKS